MMKDKENKISLIIFIPSLEGGGAERALINLLQMIDFSRFEVTLCSILKKGVYIAEVPSKVQYINLFKNNLILRLLNYLHINYHINQMYRYYIRKKLTGSYDIGISYIDSSYTDILFFLDEKINKKIAWVHASVKSYYNYQKYLDKKRVTFLKKHRYNKLDKIVFVSEDSKKEFVEIFGRFPDMPVVANIFNSESIKKNATKETPLNFDPNNHNFIAVGSLLPVKGYSKLILAVKMLSSSYTSFKVRIAGEGRLKGTLLSMIKKEHLEDFVELLGFIRNPYPLIANSDTFIMTSDSEALPTSLIEAIILNKPIIATNVPGCREVLQNGKYGYLVENSVEGIYDGMKKMMDDNELRKQYKTRASERAKDFDDKKTLSEINNILT